MPLTLAPTRKTLEATRFTPVSQDPGTHLRISSRLLEVCEPILDKDTGFRHGGSFAYGAPYLPFSIPPDSTVQSWNLSLGLALSMLRYGPPTVGSKFVAYVPKSPLLPS